MLIPWLGYNEQCCVKHRYLFDIIISFPFCSSFVLIEIDYIAEETKKGRTGGT